MKLKGFPKLEIIYYFDKADKNKIVFSGRPRGNPAWPLVGIFGQRKKDRPNQIGLCTVELIEYKGRTINLALKAKLNSPPGVAELIGDYWK